MDGGGNGYGRLRLTRKIGESIVIQLPDRRIVEVQVYDSNLGRAKLEVYAPVDVPVHRREIYDDVQRDLLGRGVGSTADQTG